LKVYDITGREAAVLLNEKVEAGVHTLDFNASDFVSGVYFYSIEAGSFRETRRMVLVK